MCACPGVIRVIGSGSVPGEPSSNSGLVVCVLFRAFLLANLWINFNHIWVFKPSATASIEKKDNSLGTSMEKHCTISI